MKTRFLKYALALFVLGLLTNDSFAQRRGNRQSQTRDQQTQQPQQQNNNYTVPPGGVDPYKNLPISVDSSGLSDNAAPKKGLRPESAFGFKDSIINERTPLPYEFLRWDDALFAEKVWREIDLREKINQSFKYKSKEDNGDQQFINILLKAVNSGQVVAFDDERFTTPLNLDEVSKRSSGGTADTALVYDLNDINKVVGKRVVPKNFNPDDITKLRIKEEWIFDRESSRMFVRIIGIAPIKRELIEGTNKEMGQGSPLFWIYYPDLRQTLARYSVYNPKNMGVHQMTWEELFESRMFSSYITKSTLDNPGNKNIRQMIKDPILALLEGDNIKERIFNYEQDLWSY